MKKVILVLVIVLASLLCGAQNINFCKFYEKYSGQDGFVSIEMSGSMFKMINASYESDEDFSNMMNKVDNLIIIVSEESNEEFMDDINEVVKKDKFTSMTTIKDGEATIRLYLIDDKIKSFLMVVSNEDECAVISITGNMNVKDITKMTKISISN